jgi:hypothetical protein
MVMNRSVFDVLEEYVISTLRVGKMEAMFSSKTSVILQGLHGIISQKIELFKYQLLPHAALFFFLLFGGVGLNPH